MPPNTILSKELFIVGGLPMSHIILKSLEKKNSKEDFRILDDYYWAAHKKGWVSGWLLDYVIDAYLYILCNRFDHMFAFSSTIAQGLLQERTFNGQTAQKKKDNGIPPKAKFLLFPVNAGASHWTLLILDVEKNEYVYLDSLNHPITSRFANLKKTLWVWFNIDSSTASFRQQKCPHQGDSISCGIFVLHNAELCAQNLPYDTPCPKDEFRVKVFEALIADDGNIVN